MRIRPTLDQSMQAERLTILGCGLIITLMFLVNVHALITEPDPVSTSLFAIIAGLYGGFLAFGRYWAPAIRKMTLNERFEAARASVLPRAYAFGAGTMTVCAVASAIRPVLALELLTAALYLSVIVPGLSLYARTRDLAPLRGLGFMR